MSSSSVLGDDLSVLGHTALQLGDVGSSSDSVTRQARPIEEAESR
jgi:hypothetical protein